MERVHHFRVLGALYHKHVLDVKRRNLDDKKTPMILVRFYENNAYKMHDPVTKKMSINKYIVLDEGDSWDWKLGSSSSKSHASSLLNDNDNNDQSSEEDLDVLNVKVNKRSHKLSNTPKRMKELI